MSLSTVGLSYEARNFFSLINPAQSLDGGRNAARTIYRAIDVVQPLLTESQKTVLSHVAHYLNRHGQSRSSLGLDGGASRGLGDTTWGAIVSDRSSDSAHDSADVVLGLLLLMLLSLKPGKRLLPATYPEDVGALARKIVSDRSVDKFITRLFGSRIVTVDLLLIRRAHVCLLDTSVSKIERALGSTRARITLKRLISDSLYGVAKQGLDLQRLASAERSLIRRLNREEGLRPEVKTYIDGGEIADSVALHPEDLGETLSFISTRQRPFQTIESAKAQSYVHHARWIDGLFYEFSNWSLSQPEAKSAAQILCEIAFSDKEECPENRMGALILLLQGLTGRHLEAIVGYLFTDNLIPDRHNLISKSGFIRITHPCAGLLWDPNRNRLGMTRSDDCAVVQLPLNLIEALVEQSNQSTGEVFPARFVAFESALKLAAKLSKSIGRFTLGRWRGVLPLMAYQVSKDPRVAQILCGDRLGLSDAPCYYGAYKNDELNGYFQQATMRWWPSAERAYKDSGDGPTTWVGSSLGAIAQDELKSWFIKPKFELGANGRPTNFPQLICCLYSLQRWSLAMFCAATGIRSEVAAKEILLNEIDLDLGLVVLGEKITGKATFRRPVAIGRVARQIRILLAAYRDVLARLPKRKLRALSPSANIARGNLSDDLQKALAGVGPLFFEIDVKAFSGAFDTDVGLSTECLPAANALRHALATHWSRLGGDLMHLYAQMGHIFSSNQYFGRESLVSVEEFSSQSGAVVNQFLDYCGCDEIELPYVEFVTRNERCIDSLAAIDDLHTKETKSIEHIETSSKRLSHKNTRKLATFANKELRKELNALRSITSNRQRRSKLASIISDVELRVFSQPDAASKMPDECRRLVSQEVTRILKKKSPRINVITRLNTEPSRVWTSHLAAHRFLRAIRDELIPALSNLTTVKTICGSHRSLEARAFRVFTILLLYLPVENADDLDEILKSCSTLNLSKKIAYITRGDGRVIALPFWLSDVVKQLKNEELEILKLQLDKRFNHLLSYVSEHVCVDGLDVEALIHIVNLAARVSLPGIFWPREPGCEPVELSEQRLRSLVGDTTASTVQHKDRQPEQVGESGAVLSGVLKKNKSHKAESVNKRIRHAIRKYDKSDKKGPGYDACMATPKAKLRTAGEARAEINQLLRMLDNNPNQFYFSEVAALRFIEDLVGLEGRVDGRGSLKLSTVRTYFFEVAEPFFDLLQQYDAALLEAEDWSDMYRHVLDQINAPSRLRAASVLQRVHQVLVAGFNVPRIAPSTWQPFLAESKGPQITDAYLNKEEFGKTLELMNYWVQHAGEPNEVAKFGVNTRLLKIARFVWLLVWGCGLRSISEACAIRHRDISQVHDEWVVNIRRSAVAGLKSANAFRSMPLRGLLPAKECDELLEWIQEERDSAGDLINNTTLIFPELGRGDTSVNKVISLISAAIRWVTGRDDARPHWGRHSFATDMLFGALVNDQIRKSSGYLDGASSPLGAMRTMLGHASFSTTLEVYAHVWNLRNAYISAPKMTNAAIAGLQGLHASSYSRTQKAGLKSALTAGHASDESPASSSYPPLPAWFEPTISLMTVGNVIERITQNLSWGQVCWGMGLSIDQQRILLRSIVRADLLMPQLKLTRVVDANLLGQLGVEQWRADGGSQSAPVTESNSQRRLSVLSACCLELDRYFSNDWKKVTKVARAIEMCVVNSNYYIVDGYLFNNDLEAFLEINECLKFVCRNIPEIMLGLIYATSDKDWIKNDSLARRKSLNLKSVHEHPVAIFNLRHRRKHEFGGVGLVRQVDDARFERCGNLTYSICVAVIVYDMMRLNL